MATSRPFAYNPSPNPTISGTEQLGNLAIGTPTTGFTNSPTFWNGPDEEIGYVIAHETPGGNQPNPLSTSAYVGFWRTTGLTDQSFISLSEYISREDNDPQVFLTTVSAKTWLNNNGYWTSFVPSPTVIVNLDASNPLSYSGVGGTWYDLSGYNNDGIISGATYDGVTVSGTFDFSGINQYVFLGQPIPSSTSFSISAWVYSTSNTGSRNIVSSESSPFWVVNTTLAAGVAGNYTIVTNPGFPISEWKYVSFVFDDTNNLATLYINGVQVDQQFTTVTYTSQNTYIGSHFFGGTPVSFWFGSIAQVKIWDGACNATTILNDYNSTKTRFGL
jgi:hypothetical protein